eukprot:EC726758.1.p1 GENE.EC726758.1~~EC726758.1.p1  ORF type:complete len:245 (+),score=55.18 EC726758.1:36-770(+)
MLGTGAGLSTRQRILWVIVAALIGAVVGVAVCELVDAFLLAITVSAGIAIVTGLVLFALGGYVVYRVYKGQDDNKWIAILNVVLAVSMFVTGIWCFLLNREITPSVHWFARVLMYAMLGAALTFLFVYALGELVSVLTRKLKFLPQVKSLQTRRQAITVLAGAVVSGVMWGITFGWKEVALPSGFDASAIAALVAADQAITVPISAVTGAAMAVALQWVRSRSDSYMLAVSQENDTLNADDDDV